MNPEEIEQLKRDVLLYGVAIVMDGHRIDPHEFYLEPEDEEDSDD